MTASTQARQDTAQVIRSDFYGAAYDLFRCRDLEVCIEGPAGTGKTVAVLGKVHLALLKYPGARALVARKTNVDLAASALVTYQTRVLHPGDGVTYFGGNRVRPAMFRYANGSELIVSGLDKPEKVKSAEYDLEYINEATECDEEDIELVRSRLRNGVMPYQQLLMDANPGAPTHWLNQRMESGKTTRLLSRHEDNPRFYDRTAGVWTSEGESYINDVLGGLTGVRRLRLLEGKWASAEGVVYDEWDAAVHVIPRFPIPGSWPRYLSIDFGYTSPTVVQWWAMDGDGRLYLYRELVQSKRTIDQIATEAKRLAHGDPLHRLIFADPEDAGGRATWTRTTGWPTLAAKKDIENGIKAVKARLRTAGDGKPRLYVLQGALVSRDPEMLAAKKPIGLVAEIDGYVWDTRNNRRHGEMPMEGDDHSLDCLRYVCMGLDVGQGNATSVPNPW